MSLPTCEHTDKHGEEVVTEELDPFVEFLQVNVLILIFIFLL